MSEAGLSPALIAAVSVVATFVFAWLDIRAGGLRAACATPQRRRRLAWFLLSNGVAMLALNAVTRAFVAPASHQDGAITGSWIVQIVACFILAEAVNWIAHYAKHRVARLWRLHSQHHVDDAYSIVLTLQTHGIEVVVVGAAMSYVLSSVGIYKTNIDIYLMCYFVANLYKHCSARMSLGPLDVLIVSPAYHRLHHARDVLATRTGSVGQNYGSVLTLWDILLSTAVWPKQVDDAYAVALGTRGNEPFSFFSEMTWFFRR
jgi:sterol desaturase/sphingolipid hydroxylase (fatty acid hydroxylase superfamily)